MRWTEEQRQTIELTGRNILVSAAAGSGKTTVLVERVKNLVINEGADIERFLITTFTKAAAAEMKERLEKEIRNEMRKPGADKAAMLRQLQQLPGAHISTFHSFAIEIIRQYFYLTDLEPGFTVADEIQVGIIRKETLDAVFRSRYEENSEAFREFILKHSPKGDDRLLKENILDTCRTLLSIPKYFDWAYGKAELLNMQSPMEGLGAFSETAEMISQKIGEAAKCFETALELAGSEGLPKVEAALEDDIEITENALSYLKRTGECSEKEMRGRLECMATEIGALKFSTMRWPGKKEAEVDEEFKEQVKKHRENGKKKMKEAEQLWAADFDKYDRQLRSVYKDTLYYIGLVKEFMDAFRVQKAKKNIIDFNDIMHYALEILENEEAAKELREKFLYIFVDEYQDSNYLQEEIIRRIARENNLFMVGDVKQCIYKFRLAEPELFIEKASEYKAEESEKSILLNLNKNFRSKVNVTEPVNELFAKVMKGYDDNAALHSTAPEEYRGFPARLHIINREDFDDDAPDKGDAEAAEIAGIIRERIGQEVYDSKAGKMRPLKYRDFAVIARHNRTVENIERYLINEGIPAYGEGSGKYFETVEVQVFLNLLRITDNMRQDVPLISAMKSAVFGFSVSELAQIRISGREGSFYSAVMKYEESGENERLREKITDMVETVSLWKEISRTVPLEDLMKIILYDTGYYDYCSGLPVGQQRISNLRLIAEKASSFEKISHGGLFGFLQYIESMKASGETDSEAKIISENENVVRVMSVHKSKGLEFPIVIFANASARTAGKSESSRIRIHRDYGISLEEVNRQERWHRGTFLHTMIANRKRREKIDEEIRILYVALTRAKDGLEIVGTVSSNEKLPQEISDVTFLDMIYPSFSERREVECIMRADANELEQAHEERMHTVAELFRKADETAGKTRADASGRETEDAELEIIRRRLSYKYPFADEGGTKPKYSVSELNRRNKEKTIALVEFDPEKENRGLTAAAKGTAMHLLMERADFAEAAAGGREYIKTVADMLLAQETFAAAEYDSLSIEKAAAFFAHDIGKRAAAACRRGELHKEKEFILSREIDGVNSVVQGIIDCFFEEDGQIVLVDYKNSYVGGGRTAGEIADAYRQQISLYREALEGATGKPVKEAYLYLFDSGQFVKIQK